MTSQVHFWHLMINNYSNSVVEVQALRRWGGSVLVSLLVPPHLTGYGGVVFPSVLTWVAPPPSTIVAPKAGISIRVKGSDTMPLRVNWRSEYELGELSERIFQTIKVSVRDSA